MQNNFEIVLGNSKDLDKFLDIFKKNKLDVLTIKQKFKFACRLRDKSGAKNGLLLLRRVASCTAQLQIITLNDLPALTRDGILSKRGVCGTAWINLQPKTIFVFGEMISEENNSTDVDSSDDTVEKTEIAIIKRGRGRPKKSVQIGGAR